jgi:hypothetical protein
MKKKTEESKLKFEKFTVARLDNMIQIKGGDGGGGHETRPKGNDTPPPPPPPIQQ